ncbi:MAG: hypothetical protein AAGG65_06265 [Pseudomonadota bacterium]
MSDQSPGAGWSRRLLIASCGAAGLLAMPATAFDADLRLTGCDAGAVGTLLGDASGLSWTGELHAVGPWTFASHVRLSCDDENCRAEIGRVAVPVGPDGWDENDAAAIFSYVDPEQSSWFAGSEPLLAAMDGVTRVVYRVEGEDAKDLSAAIADGWRGADGSRRQVFFDDDSIGGLRITARTSLACSIDGTICEVDVTTVLDASAHASAACPIASSANGS